MLTTTAPAPAPPEASSASRRRGQLAIFLQEALTAAGRLRANRQVAQDASSFRLHIKQLLGVADQQARQAGYDPASVKLGIFAFIAFLDESVLGSTQPMFAAWPRQPLQEEIFGEHVAGETFFRRLDELLATPDSEDLADLLEVYLICMLMGFRGRYALGDDGGLRDRITATRARIGRIRGDEGPIAPAGHLPVDERVPPSRDPWLPRLVAVAGLTLLLAVGLFVSFRLSLNADVAGIRDAVASLLQQ
jgi:type VI secretion system protein ImpK